MVPLLGFYSKDTAGQGHKDVQDRKTEGQKAVCPIIRAELKTLKRPQWGLVNLLLSIPFHKHTNMLTSLASVTPPLNSMPPSEALLPSLHRPTS